MISLMGARELAYEAHGDQVDKLGRPYTEHLDAVAAGVAPFGIGLEMAGYLHDVVEDTPLSLGHLNLSGIPQGVLEIIRMVSKEPGQPYQEMIHKIVRNYGATLVKIADNAHNSQPERLAQLPVATRQRLVMKYGTAANVLWPAVAYADVATILEIVNPSLLKRLEDMQ